MVAHFLVRSNFPNQRLKNGRLEKHQLHARDLLTSTVEDVDIILDWWYLHDTWFVSKSHHIPHSLLRSQLAFTILGTLAWAMVASDGHLMHMMCRALFHCLRPMLVCLGLASEIIQGCPILDLGRYVVLDSKKLIKRMDRLLDKEASAGFMLLIGIFFEDIPQTTITFLLEGLDEDGLLHLNGLAAANFLSSLYNALIKLAEAYDLRNEVLVPSGPLRTYQGHDNRISCFASINGNKFLSGSFDNKIKLWKMSRWGECIRMFEGHYHYVSCIATLGDGMFVSGSWDYTIRAWEWLSGNCIQTFEGNGLDVLAVAAIDNDRFVAGLYDNSIKLWSISTGKCIRTYKGHTDEVWAVANVGNDRFISGSRCRDGSVKLWSLTQDDDCIRTFQGNSSITCLASVNNDCFISSSADNAIRMWHLSSGVCIRTFQMHSASVTCLSVTKDGNSFLSGSKDKTIKLWNALTGECVHTFHGHTDGVTAVQVMGNGRFVSGSQDGVMIVWTMGSVAQPSTNTEGVIGTEDGYVLASD